MLLAGLFELPILQKVPPQAVLNPVTIVVGGQSLMSDSSQGNKPGRKRGLTSLTLAWLSEKLRRAEEIKEKVQSGAYQVDSEKLAASMINKE